MTTPTHCPFCNSGPYGGTSHYLQFECGTMFWDDGNANSQSPQCRINQLTARIQAKESAYAECDEQREHDLKRRLESIKP